MRKQYSIFLLAIMLSGFVFVSSAQTSKADIFSTVATCAAEASGLTGKINTWINTGLDKVASFFHLGGLAGLNPVPTNDIPANADARLRACASQTLITVTDSYVTGYVNNVMNKYKINDYFNYANTLANDVYVFKQIKNLPATEQVIIRARVAQKLRQDIKPPDFTPVYQKRSLTALNLSSLTTGNVWADAQYAVLDDPFVATPQGQRYVSNLNADQIYSNSQYAANQQVTNSQGKKDAYQCSASGNCNIQYPAQYITSQIDSKIAQIFGQELKPQDNATAIIQLLASFMSKNIDDQTATQKLSAPIKDNNQTLDSQFSNPP